MYKSEKLANIIVLMDYTLNQKYSYVQLLIKWKAIGLRSRVFDNDTGDRGSIKGRLVTKT